MANNCKIFTPESYVTELLDAVGYEKDLMGKSVLENSCGDGKILVEVVRRYIRDSLCHNKSLCEIRRGLESDICGVELEQEHVNECKSNLDREAEKFGIREVKWNIICQDYLRSRLNRSFSFIIGNPPYIVYRDIEREDRDYLKQTFQSCRNGKFDYYYAFIEKSIQDLKENGKFAYIVPASIYKNVFAELLREQIKSYLYEIRDYTIQNKFPGTTISSTILMLKKQQSTDFLYIDMDKKEKIYIEKRSLGGKWIFSDEKIRKKNYRFGDWFYVSNTIATLCNDAFLLENYVRRDGYYILSDDDWIEEEIVRPALSRKRRTECAIIFPYYYVNGTVIHYDVGEFSELFPFACKHLKKYRDRLMKRAADSKVEWFEYGRGQALQKMQYRKAVIPSVLTSHIQVVIVDEEVIPCAGFIITERGDERSLEDAKTILESQEFYNYLKQIGIFTTGKSRRLTVKDIANYTFDNWG